MRAFLGRSSLVVLHRWAGLTLAFFLIVAGITGAVLPFEKELTFLTRADVAYVTAPHPGARVLSGVEIAQRVEQATGGKVSYVELQVRPDEVARMFVFAAPGHPALPYDVVWADPYSGAVRLTYRWGGVGDGRVDLVPLLYTIHYGYVAGPWGSWTFGVAALIWTVDCFVGFILTLPLFVPRRRRGLGRRLSWWKRWGAAWKVRRHARGHRLNFDLHRAGGLWLWPLLFAFAWSSVALLLPSIERPVMQSIGATPDYAPPALPHPVAVPPIGPAEAVAIAERRLVTLGRRDGFRVIEPVGLYYDAGSASYRFDARTTLDPPGAPGQTMLWIDGRSGYGLHLARPLGANPVDAARRLFLLLHFGQIFGMPYRIFLSLSGLLVVVLSVTGLLIWLKKRTARLARRRAAGRREARQLMAMAPRAMIRRQQRTPGDDRRDR